MNDSPLGKPTSYPADYSPEVLVAIPRSSAREPLGISLPLPFTGVDVWNAGEFTWLTEDGKPEVATLEIRLPADTDNLVESKSLKLYLNGFAMARYASAAVVEQALRDDLSRKAAGPVDVRLQRGASPDGSIERLPGDSLDELSISVEDYAEVEPVHLQADDRRIVDETLHTHLLRSLCPVTRQPDMGSLLIRYRGPAIERTGLLRYLVSFRQHSDFHEACVERIYTDIRQRCRCETLTVYARYCRRGGIDINPFRTNTDEVAENPRLWRQ